MPLPESDMRILIRMLNLFLFLFRCILHLNNYHVIKCTLILCVLFFTQKHPHSLDSFIRNAIVVNYSLFLWCLLGTGSSKKFPRLPGTLRLIDCVQIPNIYFESFRYFRMN